MVRFVVEIKKGIKRFKTIRAAKRQGFTEFFETKSEAYSELIDRFDASYKDLIDIRQMVKFDNRFNDQDFILDTIKQRIKVTEKLAGITRTAHRLRRRHADKHKKSINKNKRRHLKPSNILLATKQSLSLHV